ERRRRQARPRRGRGGSRGRRRRRSAAPRARRLRQGAAGPGGPEGGVIPAVGPSGLLDIVASEALREERALAALTDEPGAHARAEESLAERLDDELRPSE